MNEIAPAELTSQVFEQALSKRGWRREFPQSPSIDKCYFTKDGERIERRFKSLIEYAYGGLTVKVRQDGSLDSNRLDGSEVRYATDVMHAILEAQRATGV